MQQRIVSALGLAFFVTVVAGVCQQRASAQVATQEANQTTGVPKNVAEPVYSVVSPQGDPVVKVITMGPRLDTLAGKTVGLVGNHAFKADVTLPAIAESLKQKYPDIKIVPYTEIDAAIRAAAGRGNASEDSSTEAAALRTVLKEKRIDAVISGNGG